MRNAERTGFVDRSLTHVTKPFNRRSAFSIRGVNEFERKGQVFIAKRFQKGQSSYALLLDYSPPQMSLRIDGQPYDLNQGRVILLGQDGSVVQKELNLPSADAPDTAFERVIND